MISKTLCSSLSSLAASSIEIGIHQPDFKMHKCLNMVTVISETSWNQCSAFSCQKKLNYHVWLVFHENSIYFLHLPNEYLLRLLGLHTNSGKGHLSINFNFVLTAIVKHTSGSIFFRLRFHKSNIVLYMLILNNYINFYKACLFCHLPTLLAQNKALSNYIYYLSFNV